MKTKLLSLLFARHSVCVLVVGLAGWLHAPPAPAQTVWGNALFFDGVSNHVQAGSIPLANLSFSIEFWAKQMPNGLQFAVSQGTEATNQLLAITFNGNTVSFGFWADDLVGSASDLASWHHWAFTYDATTRARNIFEDGVVIAHDTASANYQGSGPLFLSGFLGGSQFCLAGLLDDVRIWNVARTQAEIGSHRWEPLTGSESNLVAYWNFDETNGTIVHDASGHGHDGTLIGGAQRTLSSVPLWGSALSFDGTGGYLSIGAASLPVPWTAEFWVNRRDSPDPSAILLCDSAYALKLEQYNNTRKVGITHYSHFDDAFNYIAPTNTWVHLAFVSTNTTTLLYVNGVLQDTLSATIRLPLQRLGREYTGSGSADRLKATLDEVRIWNVARSQTQIQADMCHPLSGTESNLVAYWNLDEAGGTLARDATTNHFDARLYSGPVWTNSTIPLFINLNSGLPGVCYSSVACGDYDNDGRLDILLTGTSAGYSRIAQVWRNTGSGFVNINAGLPGVTSGSVACGDYDNDGRLDILLTGYSASGPIAQVWRNTGSGFVNINAGLPGVSDSSVAWGDYDNDGRLDILLTGTDAAYNPIAEVWRNTGSGFVNIHAGLPGVHYSSVAWGDYDNDGRLDILLTGEDAGYNQIAQVWRNTGSGFTNVTATVAPGLPGVDVSSVAWGDYDNDGRLDILLTGKSASGPIAQVWRNTGSGFVNINAGLPGLNASSAAWGDYDNDGRPDILLTGEVAGGYGYVAQVWRNTGSGFVNINAGLPEVDVGSVAWGDYDNDGRLDILLTGAVTYSSLIAQVWRNISPVPNTPPTAPANLSSTVAGRGATLNWNAASDGQTAADGLTYNLRVGTTPGGSDLVSPEADTNGFRRLPAMGNAQQGQNALLSNLPWGTNYWSVQAVDAAFAGSPFANEARFVVWVETLPATYVDIKSDAVHGQVDPLGYPTTAWFEWGDTTNYGFSTTATNLGSGNSPLPVSEVVTGWAIGTYHCRVVATNDLGLHVGEDQVFTIQPESPVVVTLGITNVVPTGATVQSEINPRWGETFAWIEYGLTTKYGAVTSPTNLGSGPDPVPFDGALSDLLPWMTYHYRAVATNSVGLTAGPDMTFTLPGPFGPGSTPSLTGLNDLTLLQGGSAAVPFTMSPAGLDVQVRCNNPVLLPDTGIGLTSLGTNGWLNLLPDPYQSGSAQIIVTASDGMHAANRTFTLTVTPASTNLSQMLYLADARVVSGETWRFRVEDLGTGSTNYTVQYRSGLSPTNSWTSATNVTDLGGGFFEVNAGPPQGDTGFYRIKGLRWLTAGLNAPGGSVNGGTGGSAVVVFNGLYTGTVRYTWSDASGVIYSGTNQVNGTTTAIPIPGNANATIGQLQYLTLQLEGGTSFALTGTGQTNITVEDNNAVWQGTLVVSNGLAATSTAVLTNSSGGGYTTVTLPQNVNLTLDFTLTILQSNGSFAGQIQSEGYGFFPTNALAQLSLTENGFTAVSTNIPMPALTGSALFGAPTYLDVRLDAANTPGRTNVQPTKISGVATLVSKVPNQPYLDSALSGTFVLQKPTPTSPTNEVPLTPAP